MEDLAFFVVLTYLTCNSRDGRFVESTGRERVVFIVSGGD
jgi:hypothetical protein